MVAGGTYEMTGKVTRPDADGRPSRSVNDRKIFRQVVEGVANITEEHGGEVGGLVGGLLHGERHSG